MTLQLLNSLTNTLEPFEHDKNIPIKWYTCGPTIYSSAHLGHARTFISFDIIRRVLIHLGYDVIYVMNITDIDDKIIDKVKSLLPPDQTTMDISIYMNFIKDMEHEFMQNMDDLNVMRPTVMTRVTEYIDRILEYIEKIEHVTYSIDNTVYLDYDEYIKHGYEWDIFKRCNTNDFSDCEYSTKKKNIKDFALWKGVKDGEISFPSKYGPGRPAWHIECSVMSNHILGNNIDIHSGGIDLIYPHHNNEIIQSIAYNNQNNPIKYFLHSGHLNINGLKMAKSLNNFITINDFLKDNKSRHLRIMFLIHNWNKPMDLTDNTIEEIKIIDKKITDFYANMSSLIKTANKTVTSFTPTDNEFLQYTTHIKQNIHASMLNNIDTMTIMDLLMDATNKTYKYVKTEFNVSLIKNIMDHMTKIFNIFGLDYNTNPVTDNSDIFVDIITDFRVDIRTKIKEHIKTIPKNVTGELFKIMDDVRDNKLKPHGIYIEDSGLCKWTKK